MAKAFVFPGQGAQFVGMGKDLYESNMMARLVYVRAMVMQKACDAVPSTMAAIIGLPDETIEKACAGIRA